ncbi:MAG: tetratricopeptide repeat protein [Ruegeria sp.]
MKQILVAPFLALSLVCPVNADTCPPAPDHSVRYDELVGQIQQAETEMAAREISNKMWELWADAPDEAAQSVLDRGMSRRSAWDLLGALQDFDRLIEYCPEYAEGYNQRAFVNFLRQDFESALTDLDRALELSPNHIAAMSGRALTLMGLQRMEEARVALAEALALNPWLPERHLAADGGPLAMPGEDL